MTPLAIAVESRADRAIEDHTGSVKGEISSTSPAVCRITLFIAKLARVRGGSAHVGRKQPGVCGDNFSEAT